jgi:chemotaxis methyl-accepting protein methylase
MARILVKKDFITGKTYLAPKLRGRMSAAKEEPDELAYKLLQKVQTKIRAIDDMMLKEVEAYRAKKKWPRLARGLRPSLANFIEPQDLLNVLVEAFSNEE